MLEDPCSRKQSNLVLSLPTCTSHAEPLEKKWKIEKKAKETSEEGEVPLSKELKPQKGAKITKGPQRRNMAKGLGTKMVSDRRTRVLIWNPTLELDKAPLPMDSSIRDFQ